MNYNMAIAKLCDSGPAYRLPLSDGECQCRVEYRQCLLCGREIHWCDNGPLSYYVIDSGSHHHYKIHAGRCQK